MASERKDHRILINDLFVGYRSALKSKIVFGPVNLEISHSEMVGIIGRNGVGKSTLLRTIAGIQEPVKGSITIGGQPIHNIALKEMARTVSFVSTETTHAFQISVYEMVSLGRFPYTGMLGRLNEADKAVVQESIELTGIAALIEKKIHEISDGERQKVMIARALAQDTPVIILDEPTAFLDLPSRYEILRILNDLTVHKNKTIIFSTHDLSIAMDISDKLWLLTENDVFEGAPEDLLINKVFRKLFLNSPAEFDPKTSTFRFKRNFDKTIDIQGDKKFRLLTKRAMERIGFRVVEEGSGLIINLEGNEDKPVWNLTDTNGKLIFRSIYELVTHLKSIKK
jgi:iron complex transport system ATP-binding protein